MGIPQFKLQRDKTLLVDGPSSILLKEGSATILGAPLQPGNSITIAKRRRIPIETETNALVEARIGESGSCQQVLGSTVPRSWKEAAETLIQTRGVAVVLGDVDAGKSTLCTYLANRCVRSRASIRIIDADIGQADIGPPTTTSSSTVSKNIFSLQELKSKKAYFIGATSPSSVETKHIQSIIHLTQRLANPDTITIVNTDGWVREERAVEHKLQLLSTLQPDLILGLSMNHELDTILDLQRSPVFRLEASKFARTRTREERKKTREDGYRRFLQNSANLEFRINKVKLRMFDLPQQQRIDQGSSHRGTLAGLLDSKGALLSIGRVLEIRNGIIRLTTAAQEQPITVELGAIILSSRFEEIGFES
jgi:polynucleotide 5'-hydroxyl-kinase GRC3/NOL9